ncbi:MAG: hypothetical protein AB1664_21360 [Thermodesulfobacteriota bacterium]
MAIAKSEAGRKEGRKEAWAKLTAKALRLVRQERDLDVAIGSVKAHIKPLQAQLAELKKEAATVKKRSEEARARELGMVAAEIKADITPDELRQILADRAFKNNMHAAR